MLVSPISYNTQYSYRNPLRRNTGVVFGTGNVVTEARKGTSLFKRIYSNRLKERYNADFVPSGEMIDRHFYPSFVFDSKTHNPYEVFICPIDISPVYEEYIVCSRHVSSYYDEYNALKYIDNPRALVPNDLKIVGIKSFSLDPVNKLITSGYMRSIDGKTTGSLLHQIAFERMLMKGFNNIKINSVESAKKFHDKMGFDFTGKGNEMTLSPEAIDDWMKIVKKHPIFIGKEFPEFR